MQYEENQKLQQKFEGEEAFNREMQAAELSYRLLQQQTFYSPKDVHPSMFVKIEAANQFTGTRLRRREEFYLINGKFQPNGEQSFQCFFRQLIQFLQYPSHSFGFIYINTLAQPNAYETFKKVLNGLPVGVLKHLTQIYVVGVEVSYLSSAFSYFSWNTLSNYLSKKTVNVQTLTDLSFKARIDLRVLLRRLPKNVLKHFEEQPQGKDQNNEHQTIGKDLHSQKPMKLISEYQIGSSGAPLMLEMLINFFRQSDEPLKLEGLFRKSVACDEKDELMAQIYDQKFSCLANVSDPHLVANAIKTFISHIRAPIIPSAAFKILMQAQEEQPNLTELVIQIAKTLPIVNRMTLILLIQFLKTRVLKFEKQNKMNENNLCIVFGPCLMRAEDASLIQLLVYANKIIIITSIIIRKFDQIFANREKIELKTANQEPKLSPRKNEKEKNERLAHAAELFHPSSPSTKQQESKFSLLSKTQDKQ